MAYSQAANYAVDYNLRRLQESVSWSRWKMQIFREIRLMFVREFAGSLYGSNDTNRRKVPFNVLATDVETYSRALIATNPQLLISTFNPQLRGEAKLLEAAVNRRLFEIRWWESLEELAMDAVFCMAVAKIGVCEENGKRITYVDVIDLDNLILDMTANKFSDVAYSGHIFRKPFDEVKNNPKYNPEVLANLHPSPRITRNDRGDPKIGTVTTTDSNSDAEPVEMVDLCEIYIPAQRRLITSTFINGEMGLDPLADEDYQGPPHGPYEFCGMTKIPGNLIPLSPVAQLFDLHDAINHITAKIIRDAENHKIVNVAQKGSVGVEDITKIMQEMNGGFTFLDNPQAITKMEMRGVNKADIAVLMQMMEMQNKQAGNPDVINGSDSAANTYGQEQMLAANSSKKILAMQEKMQGFVTRIGRAVSWHVWNEAKQEQIAVAYKVGSLETIQQLIPQGEFEDYDYAVNPYSMQDTTPQKRLQTLTSMVTTVLVPMAPVMAAQGKMFDVNKFVEITAKYTNTPEIDELVVDVPPPVMQMGMEGQDGGQSMPQRGPSKPPSTERHYTRHSKGGAQAGKKAAMASMLSDERKSA